MPRLITSRHNVVKIPQYTDDPVLFSRSRFHLQQSLATVNGYVQRVQGGLEINREKTEAMKFRRGGRLAANDEIRLEAGA